MKEVPELPSGFVQFSVTLSTKAPANDAGVVTANAERSLVSIVQLPLPFVVPVFKLQSNGTSSMVIFIEPFGSALGLVSPRLTGCPAIPAGADLLIVVLLPALSV